MLCLPTPWAPERVSSLTATVRLKVWPAWTRPVRSAVKGVEPPEWRQTSSPSTKICAW